MLNDHSTAQQRTLAVAGAQLRPFALAAFAATTAHPAPGAEPRVSAPRSCFLTTASSMRGGAARLAGQGSGPAGSACAFACAGCSPGPVHLGTRRRNASTSGQACRAKARRVLVPRRCVRQSCRTYVEEAQQCQQAAQLRLLAGGQDARARPVARKARINRAQDYQHHRALQPGAVEGRARERRQRVQRQRGHPALAPAPALCVAGHLRAGRGGRRELLRVHIAVQRVHGALPGSFSPSLAGHLGKYGRCMSLLYHLVFPEVVLRPS